MSSFQPPGEALLGYDPSVIYKDILANTTLASHVARPLSECIILVKDNNPCLPFQDRNRNSSSFPLAFAMALSFPLVFAAVILVLILTVFVTLVFAFTLA